MPVPLYLSGVVIIFAFSRSKSGIIDLILEKISHSQTASIVPERKPHSDTISDFGFRWEVGKYFIGQDVKETASCQTLSCLNPLLMFFLSMICLFHESRCFSMRMRWNRNPIFHHSIIPLFQL
jgi:hypothetical protein